MTALRRTYNYNKRFRLSDKIYYLSSSPDDDGLVRASELPEDYTSFGGHDASKKEGAGYIRPTSKDMALLKSRSPQALLMATSEATKSFQARRFLVS